MKKAIIIMFAAFTLAVAQSKKILDIEFNNLESDGSSFAKNTSYSSQQISNDQISATLIDGGYFTLGTVSGFDDSALDDHCPLSYGHPYAMTSYPVFSIDNNWYTMDSFIPGESLSILQTTSDSLTLLLTIDNLVSINFSIKIVAGSYKLSLHSTNLDSASHTIGLGFVYDPTLGAGGDGALFVDEQHIANTTIFDSSLSSFNIWERSQTAQGVGVAFHFEKEARVIAANWPQIYETDDPLLLAPNTINLYDLALKMYWPETNVSAGENQKVSLNVVLQEPDFSSDVFMRWDLPLFLSLEDNIMFPREFSTYMEVASTNNTTYPDSYIKLEFPEAIFSSIDNYELPIYADNPSYQEIQMQSKIAYEDKIVGITASIMQANEILDTFSQLVYIPATPVSDSGLVVQIDSLIMDYYPDVSFTFNVKNKETGHYIYNLERENTFVFENNVRIEDYSFSRDTTGGLDQADIIFVLDVTGSMGDEIHDVKNNIIEFADSLAGKGIDYQLGLVTFLDYIENVYPFTNNINTFHQQIEAQYAHGGADRAENSLDALHIAADFNFRELSKRIVIWITDADYHEQDGITDKSKLQILDKILTNGIVVNAIGNQTYKSQFYDPITLPSGGNYYNINGNFRDILLDISRLKTTNKYLIAYTSSTNTDQKNLKLELRYNGLGGTDFFDFSSIGNRFSYQHTNLTCYPNPFNPTITFSIGTTNYKQADLTIYNVLGQVIRKFNMENGTNLVSWQANNELKNRVSTGFYYVALKLVDHAGKVHHEKSKILYLK